MLYTLETNINHSLAAPVGAHYLTWSLWPLSSCTVQYCILCVYLTITIHPARRPSRNLSYGLCNNPVPPSTQYPSLMRFVFSVPCTYPPAWHSPKQWRQAQIDFWTTWVKHDNISGTWNPWNVLHKRLLMRGMNENSPDWYECLWFHGHLITTPP